MMSLRQSIVVLTFRFSFYSSWYCAFDGQCTIFSQLLLYPPSSASCSISRTLCGCSWLLALFVVFRQSR
ncbi:hypothetical protein F4859DRAFT_296813 [Xylaria cf. heliscus]|nr:hypothetical protein F4859DRAFT_296813 [Xylaria cf. heliscus]